MSKKLANKIAVVTGGSAGIGLGTAKRFAEEGAQVFITGRRQSELDKAVAEIGGNVSAIQGDASKLAVGIYAKGSEIEDFHIIDSRTAADVISDPSAYAP